MTSYVYIAQSLDGYIAGVDGEIDWLHEIDNPENSDFGYSKFIEQIDALVMGRNTFEKILTFGEWHYSKPVYVASSSLETVPAEYSKKAFIVNGSPTNIIEMLKAKGFSNLYIDGGALIQSFLAQGLIDKLIITSLPVLLGSGIPLFGVLESRVKLTLETSEVVAGQLVQSTYSVTNT
jgi:dihydrofolate reductase